jgi:DNA-binding MarR family transcriptional regulator
MAYEERARRLAEKLQTVLEAADTADREHPALSESLSAQEIRALRCVGDHDCPIMSAIASAIRLSLSSCTGLIDRLCAKKLVKRDRAANDRRVVQVELTDEGKKLHQAAVDARVGVAKDMLAALTPAEQDQLVALLGKAAERLEEEPKR